MDGGYSASALNYGIHTEGETLEKIRYNVKEAVGCYFNETMTRPRLIRLHFVRDEVLFLKRTSPKPRLPRRSAFPSFHPA